MEMTVVKPVVVVKVIGRVSETERVAETRKKLVFWLILDSIFSCFGKDPNRWLKVGMIHCQIVKSAAASCRSWPN